MRIGEPRTRKRRVDEGGLHRPTLTLLPLGEGAAKRRMRGLLNDATTGVPSSGLRPPSPGGRRTDFAILPRVDENASTKQRFRLKRLSLPVFTRSVKPSTRDSRHATEGGPVSLRSILHRGPEIFGHWPFQQAVSRVERCRAAREGSGAFVFLPGGPCRPCWSS